MKSILLTLLILAIAPIATGICGEEKTSGIVCHSQVLLENQINPDIPAVAKLWKEYLDSYPDSLYNNPHWNEADKARYTSYDLLRSEGYLHLYRQAATSGLDNLVLSIVPLTDNGDCYDIRSMFYWQNEQVPYVVAIVHVLARKDERGEFKLANWLHWYSREWQTKQVGLITYHYYPGYRFDESKAKKANQFLAMLRDKFELPEEEVTVYISPGWKETELLKGYDYTVAATVVSDNSNLGGTTDIDNRIIYSNAVKGEFYEHELMRLVRNHFPQEMHRLFTNGIAEYYTEDRMMRGVPIQEHFDRLDRYLNEHPEIDLQEFDRFDAGNRAEPIYLVGLATVWLTLEKGGYDLLKRGMRTVSNNDDEMRRFFDRELGIPVDSIDRRLRELIHHFAVNGFEPAGHAL